MTCINCGKETDNASEFCAYCGVGFVHLPESVQSSTGTQRLGPPGYVCFILDKKWDVVSVHEGPYDDARVLYKIGKGEPLPVVSSSKNFYEILLPNGVRGFIDRTAGSTVEMSSDKIISTLGYYRINTKASDKEKNLAGQPRKVKEVPVRVVPDYSGRTISTLKASDCVPIVEEREGWFKVQLDDGSRGFVPEVYGIRTLRKETLPFKSPVNSLLNEGGNSDAWSIWSGTNIMVVGLSIVMVGLIIAFISKMVGIDLTPTNKSILTPITLLVGLFVADRLLHRFDRHRTLAILIVLMFLEFFIIYPLLI